MKRGEAVILAIIGVAVAGVMVRNAISLRSGAQPDRGIPFYTTASPG
jgi:L-cysteine S-thiosulfotransferase